MKSALKVEIPEGVGDERSEVDLLSSGPQLSRLWPLVFDGLVIFGHALFASMFFLGFWSGVSPFVLLGGDASNISGFVAASVRPDLFIGDGVLGDPANFRFYATVHIPLWSWLSQFTGDIGTAAVATLPFHIALQGIGFYLFGRVLFESRYWAFLYSVATYSTILVGFGTFWGLFRDPLPRVMLQSLLPFILTAAYCWRTRYRLWPGLFALAGLTMYAHPVGAPVWGLALWLSLFLFLPPQWGLSRSFLFMLSNGVMFLLTAGYFIFIYLTSHSHGVTADYDKVYEAMLYRFSSGYLDIPASAYTLFSSLWDKYLFIQGTMVGLVLLWFMRAGKRREVLFVLVWALTIVIVSLVIPTVEQIVAKRLKMVPFELDLSRNVRYLIPLFLLFSFWSLAELSKRTLVIPGVGRHGAVLLIAALGLCFTWYNFELRYTFAGRTLKAWQSGQLLPKPAASWSASRDIIEEIRAKVPQGGRIFATTQRPGPLVIRYAAQRPVVFSHKDGGALGYSNHRGFLEWYERDLRYSAILSEEDIAARSRLLIDFALELRAEYLIVPAAMIDFQNIQSPIELLGRIERNPSVPADAVLILKIAHFDTQLLPSERVKS